MRNFCSVLAGSLLLALPTLGQTQPTARPAYMQIFYEGAGWLAGRPVLHYSPSFRGKTGEVVREDSTKSIAPNAYLFRAPSTASSTNTSVNGITYMRGQNGKMRPETAVERQREQAAEVASFNRGLHLVEARATLSRNALTNALNAAAADGWEVVQLTSWGGKDGLVYLLRRR